MDMCMWDVLDEPVEESPEIANRLQTFAKRPEATRGRLQTQPIIKEVLFAGRCMTMETMLWHAADACRKDTSGRVVVDKEVREYLKFATDASTNIIFGRI